MMKKSLLVLLALVSNVCFAQNIKIVGSIPHPNTGKTYQLQVGAYSQTANITQTANTLSYNGFTPRYEVYGSLTRVFVVAASHEVSVFIDRLRVAGFKEVIIREYALRESSPPAPQPKQEPQLTIVKEVPGFKIEPEPEPPVIEEVIFVEPEPKKPKIVEPFDIGPALGLYPVPMEHIIEN